MRSLGSANGTCIETMLQQHKHQVLPSSPRQQQISNSIGGVGMVQFFTQTDAERASEDQPPPSSGAQAVGQQRPVSSGLNNDGLKQQEANDAGRSICMRGLLDAVWSAFARRSQRKESDKTAVIQQHLRAIRRAENLDRQTNFRRSQVQRLTQRFDSSINYPYHQSNKQMSELSANELYLNDELQDCDKFNELLLARGEEGQRLLATLSQLMGPDNIWHLASVLARYCNKNNEFYAANNIEQANQQQQAILVDGQPEAKGLAIDNEQSRQPSLMAPSLAGESLGRVKFPLDLRRAADRRLAMAWLRFLVQMAHKALSALQYPTPTSSQRTCPAGVGADYGRLSVREPLSEQQSRAGLGYHEQPHQMILTSVDNKQPTSGSQYGAAKTKLDSANGESAATISSLPVVDYCDQPPMKESPCFKIEKQNNECVALLDDLNESGKALVARKAQRLGHFSQNTPDKWTPSCHQPELCFEAKQFSNQTVVKKQSVQEEEERLEEQEDDPIRRALERITGKPVTRKQRQKHQDCTKQLNGKRNQWQPLSTGQRFITNAATTGDACTLLKNNNSGDYEDEETNLRLGGGSGKARDDENGGAKHSAKHVNQVGTERRSAEIELDTNANHASVSLLGDSSSAIEDPGEHQDLHHENQESIKSVQKLTQNASPLDKLQTINPNLEIVGDPTATATGVTRSKSSTTRAPVSEANVCCDVELSSASGRKLQQQQQQNQPQQQHQHCRRSRTLMVTTNTARSRTTSPNMNRAHHHHHYHRQQQGDKTSISNSSSSMALAAHTGGSSTSASHRNDAKRSRRACRHRSAHSNGQENNSKQHELASTSYCSRCNCCCCCSQCISASSSKAPSVGK